MTGNHSSSGVHAEEPIVSEEPIVHNNIDLVRVNSSNKYGPYGRAVAVNLWTKNELMFKMISPKRAGRPPVSPARKLKFRSK